MKITDLLGEGWNKRDAYQRDYDSSVSGMGHKDSLAYQMDGGANDEGWDEEPRSHRQYSDVPHDVHINGKKWKTFGSHSHATNVARKIKGATVHRSLEESTPGYEGIPPDAKCSQCGTPYSRHYNFDANGNIVSSRVRNMGLCGKPENFKSVRESATAGATSAANVAVGPVYKNKPVKQPKNKDGTAKNALDINANLLTGGSIKRS